MAYYFQQPSVTLDEKHTRGSGNESMSNVQSSHGRSSSNDMQNQTECVSRLLREIPGNDRCAECSAAEPDWASLNLGILMCIECSGAHRNLGVHISKVCSMVASHLHMLLFLTTFVKRHK